MSNIYKRIEIPAAIVERNIFGIIVNNAPIEDMFKIITNELTKDKKYIGCISIEATFIDPEKITIEGNTFKKALEDEEKMVEESKEVEDESIFN